MNLDASVIGAYVRKLEPIATGLSPQLDSLGPFRAVLFDVSGTLVISGAGDIGVGRDSWSQTDQLPTLLRRYGIDIAPEQLAHRLESAIRASHAAARKRGVDHPEVDIANIWSQVLYANAPQSDWIQEFALEYELLVNPVYSMPGAIALLTVLKRAGVFMGLISNAQFYTALLLEWLWERSLDAVGFERRLLFYSYLEGHAKPSPIMFERARSALIDMAIPATSAIYVGNDMRNDIWPAASVGFKTALFAGDQRSLRLRESDLQCQHLTPDFIVTDLRQLFACAGDHLQRG
jgi:putative hydrolase of the HAD superfamily